jgi:hypothetical protein
MRVWLVAVLIGLMPGVAAAQAPPVPAGSGGPVAAGGGTPVPAGSGVTAPGGVTVPGSVAPPPSGGLVPPSISALVSTPNDFPHPTQTWNFLSPNVYPRPESIRGLGQVIRYFEVPARHVVVPVPVSVAEGAPQEWMERALTIPGYYIAETTTGYIYPERWVLELLNVGVYGWRLLPAEFLRK